MPVCRQNADVPTLFSGSLLAETVPLCPWWGGPSAAWGHFKKHERGCRLFSSSDKMLCSLNAPRSLRVRWYQQFALEKGKCTVSLTCVKASILMWQQKYQDSYVWLPVCPWNIYSTVTVWTLCSHCIICLETWNTQVDFLHAVGSADTTKNAPCPSFCWSWCIRTQWLERDLIGLRGSIYQGTRLKYRLHMTSNL